VQRTSCGLGAVLVLLTASCAGPLGDPDPADVGPPRPVPPEATLVADQLVSPWSMVIAPYDEDLYWTSRGTMDALGGFVHGDGAVFKLVGGEGTPIAIASGGSPRGITTDEASVLWVDELEGSIRIIDTATGQHLRYFGSGSSVAALSLWDDALYWATEDGRVWETPAEGQHGFALFSEGVSPKVRWVGEDEAYLYVQSDGPAGEGGVIAQLYREGNQLGTWEPLAFGLGPITTTTKGGGYIYFATLDDTNPDAPSSRIYRLSPPFGPMFVGTYPGRVTRLAATLEAVFAAGECGGPLVQLGFSQPTLLVKDAGCVRDLVVDDARLFWIDWSGQPGDRARILLAQW
jgi:hypothetical protein